MTQSADKVGASNPVPRFGEQLAPVIRFDWNKRATIFRIAIDEAQKDYGSLRDPRARLRDRWAQMRDQLKKQAAPAARVEYDRLTGAEREERHSQQAWKHPEARLIHANLQQLKVRASEAGAVIDAWFANKEFDELVRSFLAGHATAEDLLDEARRWQKSARRKTS